MGGQQTLSGRLPGWRTRDNDGTGDPLSTPDTGVTLARTSQITAVPVVAVDAMGGDHAPDEVSRSPPWPPSASTACGSC